MADHKFTNKEIVIKGYNGNPLTIPKGTKVYKTKNGYTETIFGDRKFRPEDLSDKDK